MARFHNIDPLAEEFNYQSPYNFSENRVIDAIELEGLEKISIHMAGKYKSNKYDANIVLQAKIDAGNNNKISFYVSEKSGVTMRGAYSKDEGLKVNSYFGVDEERNASIIMSIAYPKGIKAPKFLALDGIEDEIMNYTPKTLDEALDLSEEEVELNRMITGALKSMKELVKNGELEIFKDFFSDKTEKTTDKEGNPITRKFGSTVRGRVKNFIFNAKGIYFKGSLVFSFQEELKEEEKD